VVNPEGELESTDAADAPVSAGRSPEDREAVETARRESGTE
jgi:hypothetical protein